MDLKELESFLALEETTAPNGRRGQEVGSGRDGVGVQVYLEVSSHGYPESGVGGDRRLFRRAQKNLELRTSLFLSKQTLVRGGGSKQSKYWCYVDNKLYGITILKITLSTFYL